jgi:hypothetical protein
VARDVSLDADTADTSGSPAHSQVRDPMGKPWSAGHSSGGVDERHLDTMADIIGKLLSE